MNVFLLSKFVTILHIAFLWMKNHKYKKLCFFIHFSNYIFQDFVYASECDGVGQMYSKFQDCQMHLKFLILNCYANMLRVLFTNFVYSSSILNTESSTLCMCMLPSIVEGDGMKA